MDSNDGNIKPQQTGGLKLMTVFIAVLALHVVVIGGFTVYHLMTGSVTDADITLDKTHLKADGSTDTATADAAKPATDPAATASTTTDTSTSTADAPTTTPAPTKPATPAVATTVTPDKPSSTPAPVPAPDDTQQSGVPSPSSIELAPSSISGINSFAPSSEPSVTAATPVPEIIDPSAPMVSAPSHMADEPAPAPVTPAVAGPVHMPVTPAPVAVKPALTPVVTPAIAPAPTKEVAAAPQAPAKHDALAAATPKHDASAKKETYTVKITDSYKKIAKAHHVTMAQLKAANGIKDNTLHTGAKLIIPAADKELAKTEAAEPVNLAGTPSHHKTYTVEKGDTLTYLAKKFNTTRAALITANELSHNAKLTPGEKLRIPSAAKETRSAGVTAPTHIAPTPVAPVAQPAAVAQPVMMTPAPAPVSQPVATEPAMTPVATPELANMTF